ncbi:MAG: sugar ABC transporter ATP-binding protein [Oscillospiraceae bacterium]|nr:sugar ABC transporter ATP-binding protein [Oscillospiraceae bacterium]
MGNKLLEMRGIEKTFPGVKALSDCRFDLNRGEVHALVGENGAGKSTMMKILTGVYTKDSGTILFEGKETDIHGPKSAQDMGICIIHQELNLMPHLTVAQNMYIGRESENEKKFFISDREINKGAAEIFESMHLKLDPRTKVSDLTVAKQQMVEIAKALTFNSKILVMDEPTAALTETEIDELFNIIRDLQKRGVGIVYISHRMEELFRISDRVTVFRDGEYVDTKMMSETDMDEIIHMMVGRTIYEEPKTHSNVPDDAPVVLKATGLVSKDVKNVSFELKKGEILGFAGLMGAGRTETARLIFGADHMDSGEIEINGKRVNIKSPQDAVENGIAYLSEDRKRYGLATGLSVATNVTLSCLEKFLRSGMISFKKEAGVTNEYVDKLDIKTPSISQLVKFLSGGNQQKVVIAKWLAHDCDIMIFDEPTRGIDVGAKSEIYKLMNELAAMGKSIIMISSELPELLRMSDRIMVMCEGVLTGRLGIGEANQQLIMKYATTREVR